MRRVKSFWRKDTKSNLKYSKNSEGKSSNHHHHHHHHHHNIFNTCLDPNNPIIPTIVVQTIEYIEKYAINENGLFRLFGNQTDVNSLKLAYEKYETIDLSKVSNPHIVTSVLKLYLRELPEPLFTFNSYEALIVSHGISDADMRLTMIKSIIQKIVPHHLVVLEYLFAFLARVAKSSINGNNMDSSNLAIIFAPTLLKSKSETPEKLIADSPRSTSIIKIIIDNYSEIFEKDPITGQFVTVKPLKPYFEQDYLLSSKYETINLDKEIAEIFEEEESLLSSSSSLLAISTTITDSIDNNANNANNNNANGINNSGSSNKNSRPTVFQVFNQSLSSSSSLLSPAAGVVSYKGSRLSVISNDSSASSPDLSHDVSIDDDEEEELKKPPGFISSSPNHQIYSDDDDDDDYYDDDDDDDEERHNISNGQDNEIEFKIQVIKELIDKTILDLQKEFIQLEKDLQDNLSFQEIVLVASSLKSIMKILIDGPDVDSEVISSFEFELPNTDNNSNSNNNNNNSNNSGDPQQIKRLEILKKAILQKINESIPSLLLQLKDESSSLTQSDDIGKDICLVDLITIMRTLRCVNDVLDFFFSKWSIIASLSNSNNNNNNIKKSQSPLMPSPKLVSTSVISTSTSNNATISNTTQVQPQTQPQKQQQPQQQQQQQQQQKEQKEQQQQQQQPKLEEDFKITIQLKVEDLVQHMFDIDMVLYEAEETLMGISSKSELIYLAKVVQNLQKIVRLPVKASAQFDDLPPPKINTLKITPKHKLAPLVSVIYVLIKEIRDQIAQFRDNFQNQYANSTTTTTTNNTKEFVYYRQRLFDIWDVLSKLPAFNSYKTSYRNRQEVSQKNCQYMRETIESTLKRLGPLFSQLKNDVVANSTEISLDNLIVISRSVTKIKKLFEDSQLYQRTSIKFSPFQLSKTSSISISNDCFNLNSSNGNINTTATATTTATTNSPPSNSMNDKISTLKTLTASIVDQVILRFSQIEKNFNEIDQESYLFEIIDVLKSVITNFKEIKTLNI
ncbi:hypothetical protein ACTFIR_006165 [Dictyostelium discoideum]